MALTPEDRRKLEASAIPLDFALELGVHSVTELFELPRNLQIHSNGLPGMLFPWFMPDRVEYQLRPAVPFEVDGKARKYLRPADIQLISILGDPAAATRVFIVEGARQALAARAYASPDVLVIGIAGCHNAMKDGALLSAIADLIEDMPRHS